MHFCRLIAIWFSALLANFLLRPQLAKSVFLKVLSLASGTGETLTRRYQTSDVLCRWHSLHFWSKGLLQRHICMMVYQHGTKSTLNFGDFQNVRQSTQKYDKKKKINNHKKLYINKIKIKINSCCGHISHRWHSNSAL